MSDESIPERQGKKNASELSENGDPIDKIFIEPSDIPLARNISTEHTIFLSTTDEGIEKTIKEVKKKC